MCIRLWRFDSLFAASGEFFCSFNWEWFLCFFFLLMFFFCEFRENHYCNLRGLFTCKSAPVYFMKANYLFVVLGLLWGLFPQCVQLLSPWFGAAFVSREMESMGRASCQFLVGGLLTMARSCVEVTQSTPSCRALGRGSDPWSCVGIPQSIWQWQRLGMCIPRGVRSTTVGARLQCPPLLTSEVTGATGCICSRTPSSGGPHHLCCLRWLPWFPPTTCRPCKRCCAMLSPCRRCPATLSPCEKFPATCSPHKRHRFACCPHKWCLTTHSLLHRYPALWESTCAQGKIFPWWSTPSLLTLPNNVTLLFLCA